MTNFFKVIAAVAPSAGQAMQVAMPGLMLFILFNNFFVNQATAPFFMKWALYVSPMAWAIEQIIMGIYGDDPILVTLYGYDSSDERTAVGEWSFTDQEACLQLVPPPKKRNHALVVESSPLALQSGVARLARRMLNRGARNSLNCRRLFFLLGLR